MRFQANAVKSGLAALLLLGVLLMLAMLLAGCDEREAGQGADGPVIVASIHPLADLASQVAGDGFEVHTLLPAGATPHGYEATADRIRLLARSELVLTVGLGLDRWAERGAARAGGQRPVLRMADMVGIDGAHHADHHHDHGHEHHAHEHHDHGHDHAGPNPHVWLDPVLARQWVIQLRGELMRRFPDRATQIEVNAANVIASLEAVDETYRTQLADVPRRELVTFHNAFDRLAERYGLDVVAHLTEAELDHGAEVRPGRWRAAVAAVREHDLAVLYSEPQFSERELESLRRTAEVDVLQLDPLGDPRREGYRTYQQMMLSNLQTLVDGQSR